MDWVTTVSSILILLGAVLMLLNVIIHRRNIKAADMMKNGSSSGMTNSLARVHLIFMLFFFLGYVAVLYFTLNHVEFTSLLFVAVIFFFGAVFVSMGIVIQRRMNCRLQTKNEALQEFNDRLVAEQDRLLALNDQLQVEIDGRVKAQEADQMKSDFLSLVSHELRTPLTSIFGFSKLMEKRLATLSPDSIEKDKERLSDNLSIINNECCRLTRLINNILDLAKIESGRVDWDDQPVPMRELIDSSLSALRGLFLEKPSIELVEDITDDLPMVRVDTDLLIQVFINIISNAIKFTDSGKIVVSASVNDDFIQVRIADDGYGIPPEKLDHIFDKFFIIRSGDTLNNKKLGTGLGLPICKQIINHYGGRIWAESDGRSGSTLYVALPNDIIDKG